MPVPAIAAAAAPAAAATSSWLGPAIMGGASLIGSGLASAFNVSEARKNREFAKNAHQIEVEDLRKAGLNPMLSANHGGATAPSTTPELPTDIVSNALGVAQAMANLRGMKAEAALKENELIENNYTRGERLQMAYWALVKLRSDTNLSQSQRDQVEEMIRVNTQQRELLKNQTTHSALDLERAKNENQFEQDIGDLAPIIRMIRSILK